MLALGISQVYWKDPRYSHHPSAGSEWNELAWHVRITLTAMEAPELEYALRCFDFTDFNSQHTALLLTVLYIGWAARIPESRRQGEGFEDFERLSAWIGLAQLNAHALWESGEHTTLNATLSSGVRLTTESNTWASMAYDGPIKVNLFKLIRLLAQLLVSVNPAANPRVAATKKGTSWSCLGGS